MKLYSFWRSSASWRARLVLQLKGLKYEYFPVDITSGVAQHQSSDYDRLNAMQQVPTLVLGHGGQRHTLTQTVAIAELLDELHPNPPLLPRDPLVRAHAREAIQIINSGTQPLQNLPILQKIAQLANGAEASAWARSRIQLGLRAFQRVVTPYAGRFSFGDAPTLADVFLIPQLYNARRFDTDLTDLAALVAIDAQCAGLAEFQRAHPDAQPDAPKRSP